jgi:hypothetical protein
MHNFGVFVEALGNFVESVPHNHYFAVFFGVALFLIVPIFPRRVRFLQDGKDRTIG